MLMSNLQYCRGNQNSTHFQDYTHMKKPVSPPPPVCHLASYENKREKQKNIINYIPWLFGHTSLAEAGSQYYPYVHEHNPTGSHEASAE